MPVKYADVNAKSQSDNKRVIFMENIYKKNSTINTSRIHRSA